MNFLLPILATVLSQPQNIPAEFISIDADESLQRPQATDPLPLPAAAPTAGPIDIEEDLTAGIAEVLDRANKGETGNPEAAPDIAWDGVAEAPDAVAAIAVNPPELEGLAVQIEIAPFRADDPESPPQFNPDAAIEQPQAIAPTQAAADDDLIDLTLENILTFAPNGASEAESNAKSAATDATTANAASELGAATQAATAAPEAREELALPPADLDESDVAPVESADVSGAIQVSYHALRDAAFDAVTDLRNAFGM